MFFFFVSDARLRSFQLNSCLSLKGIIIIIIIKKEGIIANVCPK